MTAVGWNYLLWFLIGMLAGDLVSMGVLAMAHRHRARAAIADEGEARRLRADPLYQLAVRELDEQFPGSR